VTNRPQNIRNKQAKAAIKKNNYSSLTAIFFGVLSRALSKALYFQGATLDTSTPQARLHNLGVLNHD